MSVSWGEETANGLVSVEYSFTGESAHGAGAPWRGRSALDAVELMDVGWNFRREHLRVQQRSHSVISSGGDQPNVVPPNASVWYDFRETDYPHIKELWDIGNRMATAAALMTNTEVTWKVLGTAWPRHDNKPVAEMTSGSRVRFRVTVDNRPPGRASGVDVDESGNGTILDQRLYQLIRQPEPIVDRQFAIEFLDAGGEAYAFTFG
jgi:metal-dependent amidase/aminoacylase/carboxypeptidase family protein